MLDAHTLRVYFLGKAPQDIKQENVRITGRRRIQVVDLRICTREEAYLDDCMVITVDKTGDFSTYTLCVVELGGFIVVDGGVVLDGEERVYDLA